VNPRNDPGTRVPMERSREWARGRAIARRSRRTAARCYRRSGNNEEAARLYDEFLPLWGTEADEFPLVKKAKEERRRLRPM